MTAPYLIFGATGSIGRSISTLLTKNGHSIFLSSRNSSELQQIQTELNQKGQVADVMDKDQIQKVVEMAGKDNGLQGLAFCVGNIPLKPFRQTKEEDFIESYKLNVLSAVNALKYSEPYLKKVPLSSVVLFSTIACNSGFPNHSVISSSKGALQSLGLSLAAEWAPHIRVNLIAPSLTDSKIAAPFLKNQLLKEKIAKGHPMARTGEPADVAALAVFLLSKENSWITGQVFNVDGGKSTLIVN